MKTSADFLKHIHTNFRKNFTGTTAYYDIPLVSISDEFRYTRSPFEIKILKYYDQRDEIINFIQTLLGRPVDVVDSNATKDYVRVKYGFSEEQVDCIKNYLSSIMKEESIAEFRRS